MHIRRSVLKYALAACLVGAVQLPAAAQQWPSKPVRFVVPYAPGGINDIAARIVGAKLTESLGQQFIVENRTGGNGTIGASAVVKSAPDGYTLLVVAFADLTVSPHVLKDMPYNVETDLIPITSLTDTACVLVDTRGCHKDGLSAARAAQIVFAPRLDLDPSTAAARGQSEALLYTEFRLVEETPFWDVWVRRGAKLPAGLTTPR